MKKIRHKLYITFFIFLFIAAAAYSQEKLTGYVNPVIGTGGHGHTFPGATLPFGMVQLSPDTDNKGWDWCSGYHYSDNSIMGFSHTHLSGTGAADYGDILFMPYTGEIKTEPGDKTKPGSGYRSRFSHKNENASPAYYSVLLDDYKIKAELTASKRAGFHKYTFPKTDKANIIIDLVHGIEDMVTNAEIKVIDNKTIAGFRRSSGWAKNHCVYFYAEFSKPFKSFSVVEDGKISADKQSAEGKKIKGVLQYSTAPGEIILVKVGISHTSAEGAKNNLQQEIPGWNFNDVKKQGEQAWDKELSAVSVSGKNKKEKIIFYTALYHALIQPNILSDADGNYIGMDNKIHKAERGEQLTVFSLWDTFRGENPLITIIDRNKANDVVRSLISKYKEQGLLPVWELASNETGTMIGYHSIPVIADAYFKGIRDYDVKTAFEAMKKSAMQDHLGLQYYKEMGYIPSDLENESVSKTLEYSYDDWCIAQMAKDPAIASEDDYNYFIQRAKYYSNVFDPSTSLMRAKKNGKWFEPFDPYSVSGNYTEANAWQYSFFVPQDINGLINLMGGDKKFIAKLDELFTTTPKLTGRFQSDITGLIGQYAHGNEPSHHMAYLYNYAGEPFKTQQRVNEILTTLYTDKPDGLPGNEDCGQMSAWFVLSSMGFYPVCPGDNKYSIGTTLFDNVKIKTGDKYFTVKANNLSAKNFYIQSAKLNGMSYSYSYITHQDLVNGGELVLEMGPKPSGWGTAVKDRPVSYIDVPFVPVPFLTSGERVFRDSINISISAITDSTVIYYTTDGSDPLTQKNIYSVPFVLNSPAEIKAVSVRNGIASKVITAVFNQIPAERNVVLNTKYSPSYTGGGSLGLIDGIKGTYNFHTDPWQGYEGVDLDAVIDLGHVQEINSIDASFLQSTGSWIFFPSAVHYAVSEDGKNFTPVYDTTIKLDEHNLFQGIRNFKQDLPGTKARYIKVVAKNLGVCPDWHIGAGGKAWLFVDEISVR